MEGQSGCHSRKDWPFQPERFYVTGTRLFFGLRVPVLSLNQDYAVTKKFFVRFLMSGVIRVWTRSLGMRTSLTTFPNSFWMRITSGHSSVGSWMSDRTKTKNMNCQPVAWFLSWVTTDRPVTRLSLWAFGILIVWILSSQRPDNRHKQRLRMECRDGSRSSLNLASIPSKTKD